MWRKRLVVKNLPGTCSESHLQNYLEVVTDVEIEDNGVEFFAGVHHTALVTFTETVTEECVTEAERAVRREPLEGNIPVLLRIMDPPTSILVCNLHPELSEEIILLYFEGRRSGGVEGAVTGVEMYPQLKMAVVNFESSEVAEVVLAKGVHVLQKIKLHVQPCYKEFHEVILHELGQRGKGAEATSHTIEKKAESDSTSRGEVHKTQKDPEQPPSHHPQQPKILKTRSTAAAQSSTTPPSAKMQVQKPSDSSEDDEYFQDCQSDVPAPAEENVAEIPASRVLQRHTLTEKVDLLQRPSPQADHAEGVLTVRCFSGSPSFQHGGGDSLRRASPLPEHAGSICTAGCPSDRPKIHDGIDSFQRPSPRLEHTEGVRTARCSSGGSGIHDEVFVDEHHSEAQGSTGKEGLGQPDSIGSCLEAGSTGAVASSSETHEPDPLESELLLKLEKLTLENENLKKQAAQVMVQVEVPSYQLALLSDFAKADHGCKVTFSENKVLLHGSQEECEKARSELLTQIQKLDECNLTVLAPIIKLLKSEKGARYLDSVLQNHPKCTYDVRETSLVFASSEEKNAETIMEDVKNRIVHKCVKVHTKTLQNASFMRLKKKLEDEYLVHLTSPTTDVPEIVEVDGFDGYVDLAIREVDEHNHTHQPITERFHIPGMLAKKMCEQWFSNELEKVKTLILKNGGEVTREDPDVGFTMVLECRQEVVEEAREILSAIKDSIFTVSVDLKSAFSTYSECALVINGLHNRGAEEFCLQIERALQKDEELNTLLNITLPPRCLLPELSTTKGSHHSDHQRRSGHHRHSESRSGHGRGGHHYSGHHHHGGHSRYIKPLHVPVGSATITVKSGNITREKVDVLVNIVAEDLDMKQTAVGSAILRKYRPVGQQLLAYKRQIIQGANQCQVFQTPIPSNQQTEHQHSIVLHAVLQRWPAGTISTNVTAIVQKCLVMAMQARAQSISFPPLGIGRKFKFPEDVVASTMLNTILKFLETNPGSMQRISIIAYDPGLARMFRETMRQKLSLPSDPRAAAAAVTPEDTTPQVDEDDQLNDDLEEEEEEEEDTEGIVVAEEEDESTDGAVSDKFEALICIQKPVDNPDIVEDRLVNSLRNNFLHTVYELDSKTFRKLGSAAMDEIREVAKKNSVVIVIHKVSESELQVRGEKSGVTEVVALITRKLWQYKERENVGSDTRKKIGLPENTHLIPSYWKIVKKTPSRKLSDALRHGPENFRLEAVTIAEHKSVENLVMATWEADKAGAGKDARGLTHQNIKVLKVERLENLTLWELFSQSREKLFSRLEWKKIAGFDQLAALSQRGALKTTQSLPSGSLLSRDIYPQVNEHYLFHGTKKDSILGICRDGLDFRLANDKTMLGRGIYAAESSTKADQYADPKTGRTTGGELVIILMRALLGEPYVNQASNPQKFQRPPCKSCLQQLCDCVGSYHCDSIIDDSSRIFREFVLFGRHDCYPEYLITYVRSP